MSDVEEKEEEVKTVASPATAPATAPAAAPGYSFDDAFQKQIAALVVRDTVFAQRTDGLVEPGYFEHPADQALVSIGLDFYKKYKKAPDPATLVTVVKDAIANKKIRKELIPDLKTRLKALLAQSLADRDYAIEKVAEFAQFRAMENAIMQSISLLEKGDREGIRKLVGTAMNVGVQDDASEYDYFGEVENRTKYRNALVTGIIKPDGITTGYADIDKHLYHGGWGRRELSAIMARAKFGKSMGLGDFGKNAAMAGYNVLIVSCEVSASIYADRLDANFAETAMNVLKNKAFDVEAKIKAAAAKAGILKIHDFAAGTLKASQLRRLIERYRTRGVIFDLIVVDYADIMCPERMTDSPTENSKSIWIDLRAIAYEQNAAVLTATQTNRGGAKAMTAQATDVAEDYNKVRIADLLISGNANEAEITVGEARLHFAASRNQKEVTIRVQQKRDQMKFVTKVLGVM